MKHVTVLIPTRGRVAKLRRCLDSIPESESTTVAVMTDNCAASDLALSNAWLHCHKGMASSHTSDRSTKGSVWCRNEAIRRLLDLGDHINLDKRVLDGILFATDDIIFQRDTITNAMAAFNERFPDDDGVVGIAQDQQHHPTGVFLMGCKFLDRYPEHKPFFPGYWHFACQEVHWLAMKLGKFHYESTAMVRHTGPVDQPDQTHRDARIRKAEDMALKNARKAQGLIWGET